MDRSRHQHPILAGDLDGERDAVDPERGLAVFGAEVGLGRVVVLGGLIAGRDETAHCSSSSARTLPPSPRMASTVDRAITREPTYISSALTAVVTPTVPAMVEWARTLPSRSACDIS